MKFGANVSAISRGEYANALKNARNKKAVQKFRTGTTTRGKVRNGGTGH